MKKEIIYGSTDEIYSADPMEFDAFSHHLAFSSVLAPLVSNKKKGEHVGVIADKWNVSSDLKTWTFHIRENLTFTNGKHISLEEVRKSLTRISYLQLKKNSCFGLCDSMIGLESLKFATDFFQGISIKDDSIVLQFNKPKHALLDQISFGVNAIVCSDDYDLKTGLWKNAKSVTTSGPYKIDLWNKEQFVISKRDNFLDSLWLKNRPSTIKLFANQVKDSDIETGFSGSDYLAETHDFVKGGLSTISFLRFTSKSVFATKECRNVFRNLFYKHYSESGFEVSYSFFPKEFQNELHVEPKSIEHKCDLGGADVVYSTDFNKTSNRMNALENAIVQTIKDLNGKPIDRSLKFEDLMKEKKRENKHPQTDIFLGGSFFRIDSVDETLRFMYMSKEGIELPYENLAVLEELNKDQIDYKKVDSLMKEDNLFFAYSHRYMGFLVNKKIKLDFSKMNLFTPPMEFQWLGIDK